MRRILVLIVGLILLSQLHVGITFKLVCYFANWAQHRPGVGKFIPENIPPCLCTHLIYAFATIGSNHKITTKEQNDEELYKSFNNLKKQSPQLKTLLGIGGWNFGTQRFTSMVSTKKNRTIFINSAIQFLKKHNFDGLNLDWKYPAVRGSPADDKKRYSILLMEMKKAFQREAKRTNNVKLLISAAVAAKNKIDAGFEISKVAKNVDFINLVSYGFHGAWDRFTGHSPLYRGTADMGANAKSNVIYAANYWIRNGLPAKKMIIGFPTFGRTFTLKTSNGSVGAAATGPGPPGSYTREAGFLAYYEVCDFLKNATSKLIKDQMVSYAVKKNIWLGYDNLDSFQAKAQWLKRNKYGGAFVWTIDLDDFHNHCQQGVLPLTTKLNKLLKINPGCKIANSPFINESIKNKNNDNTEIRINAPWCFNKTTGVYVDPKDSTRFYRCDQLTTHERCADGLVFDKNCLCCNWPENSPFHKVVTPNK
ncbi:acidic mammalian chitinase-like isoform X1 [Stegostoma tigrinum]|uniref:acidic mammalian chitinase-like isoform X1 n=1 Tax=Stegostoma tigrinum TaxID=3053191 RepID=UPI00202B4A4D|nr:acidic mammalian chitinase-like isoform X1 [Stegostoma tigrinum]